MKTEHVIEVVNLTKKFGNFTAVDKISFNVNKGEIFGFLGANGAGKTTAMKMLCGLSFPTSGIAHVAGYNVAKAASEVKKNIGYMSQKFSLYNDLKVFENIDFYGGIYGLTRKEIKERGHGLLERLDMKSESKTMVSELPLGWKQKLAFSISVMHNPAIIFLDEPTGGVDPVTRRQFWKLIYEAANEGITAFVTTHYMDESEYCDRVAIMVDGKIEAIGSPKKLKNSFKTESMGEVFYLLARNAQRGE